MEALRFGTLELRPSQRQLLVAGSPATIGARAFDLLVALIERRERPVSKSELLEVVWPGLVVEENLQVQVSALRKVLGQQAIAELHRGEGNADAAVPLYEEALALAREHRDVLMTAIICDNLARALLSQGKVAEARDLAREVLAISGEARSRWIGLCAFDSASALAAIQTDWIFAARMRGAAEGRVRSMKHCRDRADAAFLGQWTSRIRESLADPEYQAAFDAGYSLLEDRAGAEALTWLAANEAG